ncbi:MAG: pirin family protein [Bacteroidota bacterium]
MNVRSNPRILKSERVEVAPGAEVWRPFPVRAIKKVGPFILWDHFGPHEARPEDNMVIPPHPHAGFQAVTYLMSGLGYHKDSFAGEQYMKAGGVNWMTAGKGIVHAEKVLGEQEDGSGRFEGFQIWVNLPAAFKEVDPGFEHYTPEELPIVNFEGGSLRIIAGEYKEVKSPVHTYSPLFLFHLSLKAGTKWQMELPTNFEVAAYVSSGEVKSGTEVPSLALSDVLLYHEGEGGLELEAIEDSELMIMGGELLREPMATYGPFVMNQPDEIRAKILAFQNGQMGNVEM